jgi:hypothetical protein
MNKSNSNSSSLDSNYNYQNSFNDEENSLNSFKDSINHKNGSKDMQLDFIDTGISSHKKEDCIDNNKVLNDNETNVNLLGRKKKDSSKENRHDKYAKDNIIKKIKTTLLNYLLKFINRVIKNRYNGNIGHDVFKKQLLNIDKEEILSSGSNKPLLKKTLKDIFSGVFNSKYKKNYVDDHNKNLINELLKDKDKEKRDFFKSLFNLTFIDCLNHLRGNNIEQLHGLGPLNDILKEYEDEPEYKKELEYYFDNFEKIIENSRVIKNKKKAKSKSQFMKYNYKINY